MARYTILHSTARPDAWAHWARNLEGVDVSAIRRLEFPSSTMAFQAAIQGMGIALGDESLIKQDIDSGALVSPIDVAVDAGESYCLVYASEHVRNERIKKFRDWIVSISELRPPIMYNDGHVREMG